MNTAINQTQVTSSTKPLNLPSIAEQANDTSIHQQLKAEMNVAIMESAKTTIGAQDNSLTLLFNAAIDKINEQLAPELGENAIQKAYDSGLDVSPEATAERIVSLSTLSYHAYKENHQGADENQILDNYIQLISDGIDQGFGEAKTILDGLNVLEGELASNIDKTYELVQEKLSSFKELMAHNLNSDSSVEFEQNS